MVLKLDDNSEYVAHVLRKLCLFGGKKYPICDSSNTEFTSFVRTFALVLFLTYFWDYVSLPRRLPLWNEHVISLKTRTKFKDTCNTECPKIYRKACICYRFAVSFGPLSMYDKINMYDLKYSSLLFTNILNMEIKKKFWAGTSLHAT